MIHAFNNTGPLKEKININYKQFEKLFSSEVIDICLVNPIQDWPVRDAHGGCGWGWGVAMKLGTVTSSLKKIQNIYESRGKPLEFC